MMPRDRLRWWESRLSCGSRPSIRRGSGEELNSASVLDLLEAVMVPTPLVTTASATHGRRSDDQGRVRGREDRTVPGAPRFDLWFDQRHVIQCHPPGCTRLRDPRWPRSNCQPTRDRREPHTSVGVPVASPLPGLGLGGKVRLAPGSHRATGAACRNEKAQRSRRRM